MDTIKCTACGHDAYTEHGKMGCDHVNDNGEYDCFCELFGHEVKQFAEIARLHTIIANALLANIDMAATMAGMQGELEQARAAQPQPARADDTRTAGEED
jgi:hypothetical protein